MDTIIASKDHALEFLRWRKEVAGWIQYLEILKITTASSIPATILDRIIEILGEAEPPGSGTFSYDVGTRFGEERLKTKLAPTLNKVTTLQNLLAIAINRLNDDVITDIAVTGGQLRDHVLNTNLIIIDDLQHAPRCPANHYHKTRLPTDVCNCGALHADDATKDLPPQPTPGEDDGQPRDAHLGS